MGDLGSFRSFIVKFLLQRGNIFIIDLSILDGVCCGKSPIDGSPYFSCAPICLLYLNNKKQLVPIAIQLGQKPGSGTPIWTPEDSESDWMLAKIYFRNAESNVQLVSCELYICKNSWVSLGVDQRRKSLIKFNVVSNLF